MNSSCKRAIGLLGLIAVSWSAVCEVRQPHPTANPGASPTTGRTSAQLRIGLVLVAANELQTVPPAPSQLDFPASPSAVLCRSDAAGYRECATPFRGRVLLSREVDNTRCVEGRNWGWREGAVWVDRGCAAVFLRASAAIASAGV